MGPLIFGAEIGDALDFVAALDDECVDAIITDPPYCSGGVGETQRTKAKGQGVRAKSVARFGWFQGDNMGTAGLVWLLRSIAFESMRVLKPSGHFVVFCDWRMLVSIEPAIESTGLRFQNLIVWDKGAMGLGSGFRRRHELALHFTRGAPEYHDRSVPNVLTCKRVKRREQVHQTQKPVDLLRPIVRVTSPPDGLIVDPFMGSGSTGVAALLEGRNFFGCDREAAHARIANKRFAECLA